MALTSLPNAGLRLEPEYLFDRLRDECQQLNLPAQATEMIASGEELLRLEVNVPASDGGDGVRLLLHVMPQDTDGAFKVLFTRLSGDTFEFHNVYRDLHKRFEDLMTGNA